MNWRDVSHPEGGGSERYVQRIAEGLAAAGLRVTLLCAEHGRAPREETVNGVRIVRRGRRLSVYPRINPAIMVLITNGREILLARKPAFPRNRFSALAGFVEAGESLEETVARESFEEVGVEVRNIRYFGSQSWPFPNSLMIAFTAEYAGGEIRPDGAEIEEARWFDPTELPNVPDRISISRWLIDAVCAELLGKR